MVHNCVVIVVLAYVKLACQLAKLTTSSANIIVACQTYVKLDCKHVDVMVVAGSKWGKGVKLWCAVRLQLEKQPY